MMPHLRRERFQWTLFCLQQRHQLKDFPSPILLHASTCKYVVHTLATSTSQFKVASLRSIFYTQFKYKQIKFIRYLKVATTKCRKHYQRKMSLSHTKHNNFENKSAFFSKLIFLVNAKWEMFPDFDNTIFLREKYIFFLKTFKCRCHHSSPFIDIITLSQESFTNNY